MQSKQKKTLTAIAAGVMAVVMALTGTFAWQSISQRATNEAESGINPGGRLHDDFNGTNKDVYVENFTGEDGADIFARVRLDEYMEIGKGAGLKDGDAGYTDKKATPLVTTPNADGKTPDINDTTTWTTHIPSVDNVADSANPFHSYYTWDMAGETVYMPTFNTNKDSLEAEINGTLEGKDGVPYGDYREYALGATVNGYEIWDIDSVTPPTAEVDELAGNVNLKDVIAMDDTAVTDVEDNYSDNVSLNKGTDADADGKEDGVTHTAKATLNSQVITMAEWKEMGAPIGAYWVYDVDGWAYWAAPIAPGTATGLLLDGITLNNKATGDLYYAIEVVAQFASSGDWGAEDGTGFYNTNEGVAPTADALALLNKAANITDPDLPEDLQGLGTIIPGSTETVELDGVDWYVLAKEDDKALLWAAESVVEDRAFDADSNVWDGSDMQAYLNRDYLNGLTTLKKHVAKTTLTTSQDVDRTGYNTTTDKVFLLSEADIFGTANGEATAEAQEYTLGEVGVIVTENMKTNTGNLGSWLRSPRNNANNVAYLYNDGTPNYRNYTNTLNDARPALWVNLKTNDEETPLPEELQTLAGTVVGQKVTIDNTEWWVLAHKNGKALIWSVESVIVNKRFDDNSNVWDGSEMQTYLNNDYLDSLTTLKDYVAETTIKTAANYSRPTTYTETTDKIFLLTEADIYGTANGDATSVADEYTLGEVGIIVTDEMKTNTGVMGSWLRSPRGGADCVAHLNYTGNSYYYTCTNTNADSRPAMWVDLGNSLPEVLEPLANTAVGQKVTLDNTAWWVLANEDGKALLWTVESVVQNRRFDDNSNVWDGSEMQTYLNNDYLDSLTTLKDYVAETTIKTAATYNRPTTYIETTDKVFLLTAADVFGNETEAQEYTLGRTGAITTTAMRTNSGNLGSLLRSPTIDSNTLAYLYHNGSTIGLHYTNTSGAARPALWVDLATEDDTSVTPETPTVPEVLQPLADTEVGQKVTLDSAEWWVLAKEDNKALIWTVESPVVNRAFDADSNVWEGSDLQTYLNGDYLNSLTTLKDYAAVTTLTTAQDAARSGYITSTTDKVFLLSEADVFGTANGTATSDTREYTLGEARVIVTSEMLTNSGSTGSWLRSPRDTASNVAFLNTNGTSTADGYSTAIHDSRPAIWVDLVS